jgi:hypothetical protein
MKYKGMKRRAATVPKMNYVIRNDYCTANSAKTAKEETSQQKYA